MNIVDGIGPMDMLKSYLTEDESYRMLSLAISKIERPLPQNSISRDIYFTIQGEKQMRDRISIKD